MSLVVLWRVEMGPRHQECHDRLLGFQFRISVLNFVSCELVIAVAISQYILSLLNAISHLPGGTLGATILLLLVKDQW